MKPHFELTCEYSSEAETPFSEDFFTRIVKETLILAHLPFLSEKKVSLSAISVGSERIRELNRTYRQKDSVTDILSFGEYENLEALHQEEKNEVFLGELYFCPEYIEKAAEEDKITFEHEMVYIFSHGVLHLLGYDHSDRMFAIQDAVTDTLLRDTLKQE